MKRVVLVYVAGKFTGRDRAEVERNIAETERRGIEVAKLGAFPVVPHANTSHPEYEKCQRYEFWIDGTIELMRRCDALITVDNWKDSSGAIKEVGEMLFLAKPVFHQVLDLATWLRDRDSEKVLEGDLMGPPYPRPKLALGLATKKFLAMEISERMEELRFRAKNLGAWKASLDFPPNLEAELSDVNERLELFERAMKELE